MNEDDLPNRHRHFSISSERTLDNLETLPSTVTSPVQSPNSRYKGAMDQNRAGFSQPPHHRHDDSDDDRKIKSKVSWKDNSTSQFSLDVHGNQGSSPGGRGHSPNLTPVRTGSDSSPVRRLKRKDAQMNQGAEDSDGHTWSPKPLKPPRDSNHGPADRSPPRKHRDRSADDGTWDDSYQLDQSNRRRKSKKKRKHKETNVDDNGQVNEGFDETPDQKQTSNNGGQMGMATQLRSSLTNLSLPFSRNQRPSMKVLTSMCNDSKKSLDHLDEEILAKFVNSSGICQRQCKVYVRDVNVKEPKCYCGRSLAWHEEQHANVRGHQLDLAGASQRSEIWHHKTHTESLPTDSFGIIQFQGFGQDTENSPYIRLCPETDLESVWDLLTKYWKLPVPKLLISVTGGAQRFEMNPRLKNMFKRGLVNAATTTGAWIITGGTATGVMKFVGEAVRDHVLTTGQNNSVVALGIATWGCVANRDALDGDGESGLFPATYSMEDLADVTNNDVPLDHNHTHFLLVDNGTEGKFGREIEFRAMFERYVSEKVETGVAESQSVNVPTVLLVVEGGVNTMVTVCQAMEQKIPILLLDGSGRAADFIAIGYMLSKDPKKNEEKSYFDNDFDEEMKMVARKKFSWKSTDDIEKKVHECLRQLKVILKTRRLINIFNLTETSTKDIDRAILYALLKANKTNANAQLSLALAWNRSDIARDEIFTVENRQYWKNVNLYDAMFTALVQDRVDFVQLFLENGVSIKKFLSIKTLWNLYANTLKEKSDSMSQLLTNLMLYLRQSWMAYLLCQTTQMKRCEPDLLYMVGKVVVYLIGDENMNPYKEEKFVVKNTKVELKWLPGKHDEGCLTDRPLLSRPSGPESYGAATPSSITNQNHVNDTTKSDNSDKSKGTKYAHIKTKITSTVAGIGPAITDNARKFFKRRRQEFDFNKSPERELFFWAILLNRREMARMFWRAGQDQIGAALVAAALLKALSGIADADEELELSQDLLEHANLYEDMAVGVLSECYKMDKQMARQLLVRKLEQYGNMTLFSMADSHTLVRFMGHTCCQTKLNLIWKGNMAQYTQNWKICLCFLLPVMIPAKVIKFTRNDSFLDDDDDDYDELEEEEMETTMEDVHIISNKVMPSVEGKGKVEEELFVRSKTRRKRPGRKRLYDVNLFGDTKTNKISLFTAIYFFYTAPVTVFAVNVLSSLAYLGLFTFFVLTNLYEKVPSVYEYITWGWTLTMVVEEFRQVLASDKLSLWYKLRNWISSMWNRFDLIMYLCFILSVIFRLNFTGDNFVYARVLYSVTLAMYYMRFMQMFFAEKNVGPKVIMIRNMLIDLAFFLGIFLVFMCSFGVVYQANLFPNSEPSVDLIKSVLYIPYWQMYGELFLENMEGEPPEGCTRNESIWRPANGENRCPEKNTLVPILAAAYLILTNILLVNLLIAMFNYTFQMVQDQSEQVWRFFRYSLVYEFYDRPFLCPPFSILVHIWRLGIYIMRRTCSISKYTNQFRLNLDEKDNNRLTVFVRTATENYLNITHKANSEAIGNRVANTATRIEKVIEELDGIKETVIQGRYRDEKELGTGEMLERTDTPVMSARKTSSKSVMTFDVVESQLRDLSDQVTKNSLQMSQIMDILRELTSQRSQPHRLEITHMGDNSDD